MRKSMFTEEQIIGILKEHQAGSSVNCPKSAMLTRFGLRGEFLAPIPAAWSARHNGMRGFLLAAAVLAALALRFRNGIPRTYPLLPRSDHLLRAQAR